MINANLLRYLFPESLEGRDNPNMINAQKECLPSTLFNLLVASCRTSLRIWSADYDEAISQSSYLRGIRFSLYQIPDGRRIESDAWQLCMPRQITTHDLEFDSEIRYDLDSPQAKKFVEECVLNAMHVYQLRKIAYVEVPPP